MKTGKLGEFQLFDHQIGGFTRFGKKITKVSFKKEFFFAGNKLYKPLDQKENDFYVKGLGHDKSKTLDPIVPRYFGVKEIDSSTFIELENLSYGYTKPCIADIKLGTKTYPTAPLKKIEAEKRKCPYCIQIGYRFIGMKIFENGEYTEYKKAWGKKLKPKEMKGVFCTMLSSASVALVEGLMNKISEVRKRISRCKFWFYASSLLVIFEGFGGDAKCTVKLIDFDHVFQKKDYPKHNDGVCFGLDNILKQLQEVKEYKLQNKEI